jgi:hypothetical protein
MRRHLLDLCLLAYPRPRRDPDRRYLCDLALDLSETYGLRRQALSLLRGGLTERIEVWRRRRRTGRSAWSGRAVAASLLLAAAGVAAIGLGGAAPGSERVEADRFVCVETEDRRSGAGACAQTKSLVGTRLRAGWDCTPPRHTRDSGVLTIAWRCSLGQESGAWNVL